ncbi:uncharacterized protein LOC117414139 isoform X3 [Acipenser ruthenus]|uniref:uncharacterized protein LOC117414139 isoform X3 n=1 Tax=Acipenser ruthenus TaxID=7906 RepID=UPI002741D7A8|nr:uncharacterized protein LOC117414139 isoform X3 [Acipenser ruthenus]
MFCPFCGNTLEEISHFCSKCGKNVHFISVNPEFPPSASPLQSSSNPGFSNLHRTETLDVFFKFCDLKRDEKITFATKKKQKSVKKSVLEKVTEKKPGDPCGSQIIEREPVYIKVEAPKRDLVYIKVGLPKLEPVVMKEEPPKLYPVHIKVGLAKLESVASKEEAPELDPVCMKEEAPELEPVHMKEEPPELEPVHVKEEAPELEPVHMKEEAPELEPVHVKEEAPELEPVHVKEEAPELEPVHMKEEAPELEPVHMKEEAPELEPVNVKEEAPELEPVHMKVEAPKLEPVHMKEEASKLEPVHIKEEAPELEPVHVKEEAPELEPVHMKEEAPELEPVHVKEEALEVESAHVNELAEYNLVNTKLNYCKTLQGSHNASKQSNVTGHPKKHHLIPTGEEPYFCAKSEISSDSKTLKRQRIFITGKTYNCTKCGKCFSVLRDLKRHEQIHTGERHKRWRFSEEEELVVMEQVAENWHRLFGQESKALRRGGKVQIWNEAAKKVSAVLRYKRTGDNVYKKWLFEKKKLRDRALRIQALVTKTGSVEASQEQLTPLEVRLVALMGEECERGVDDVQEMGPGESSAVQLPEKIDGASADDTERADHQGSGSRHSPQQSALPTQQSPNSAQTDTGCGRRQVHPVTPTLESLMGSVLERQGDIFRFSQAIEQHTESMNQALQSIATSMASMASSFARAVDNLQQHLPCNSDTVISILQGLTPPSSASGIGGASSLDPPVQQEELPHNLRGPRRSHIP